MVSGRGDGQRLRDHHLQHVEFGDRRVHYPRSRDPADRADVQYLRSPPVPGAPGQLGGDRGVRLRRLARSRRGLRRTHHDATDPDHRPARQGIGPLARCRGCCVPPCRQPSRRQRPRRRPEPVGRAARRQRPRSATHPGLDRDAGRHHHGLRVRPSRSPHRGRGRGGRPYRAHLQPARRGHLDRDPRRWAGAANLRPVRAAAHRGTRDRNRRHLLLRPRPDGRRRLLRWHTQRDLRIRHRRRSRERGRPRHPGGRWIDGAHVRLRRRRQRRTGDRHPGRGPVRQGHQYQPADVGDRLGVRQPRSSSCANLP